MTVQDDERERELVRLFNLQWDPSHQRSGVDALLTLEVAGERRVLDVEVKSTTKDSVSTARDVGLDHIQRWRQMLFVIGFYSREARRPELQRCLCLTPLDMAPWIDGIAAKVELDFRIAERASRTLGLGDLEALFGAQAYYSLEQAQQVLRQQWSRERYLAAADATVAGQPVLSPPGMLAVLRARALYIAQRGATLNNPHITASFLARFAGTDREVNQNWAAAIRRIAVGWLSQGAQPG